MPLTTLLEEIGVSGFVDIAFVALLIYGLLVWLRKTRRALFVLGGILIVTLIYLLAQQFDLRLMVAVLQGFFAVFLIALVVIFQEELRYLFERIAAWSLGRKLPLKRRPSPSTERAEMLTRTLSDLARERIGALVVLRGHDLLARHLVGGEEIDGHPSEALLKSLFDPHSVGHDGAVILEGERIMSFGAQLPLSRNPEELAGVGTRHAAALGLSERTDALCVVVSEEQGSISAARHGRLRALEDSRELQRLLEAFFEETAPRRTAAGWRDLLRSNVREKIVALVLAVLLWFVLVHESRTVYRSFSVPVELAHLPAGMTVTRVEPPELQLTFSAPRKSFYFVKPGTLRVAIRTWDLAPGRTDISVTPSDLSFPQKLMLENIKPRDVVIEVEAQPPGGAR